MGAILRGCNPTVTVLMTVSWNGLPIVWITLQAGKEKSLLVGKVKLQAQREGNQREDNQSYNYFFYRFFL